MFGRRGNSRTVTCGFHPDHEKREARFALRASCDVHFLTSSVNGLRRKRHRIQSETGVTDTDCVHLCQSWICCDGFDALTSRRERLQTSSRGPVCLPHRLVMATKISLHTARSWQGAF